MDIIPEDASGAIEDTFKHLGQHKSLGSREAVEEVLRTRKFRPVERRSRAIPR
jgi:hypothetical protein